MAPSGLPVSSIPGLQCPPDSKCPLFYLLSPFPQPQELLCPSNLLPPIGQLSACAHHQSAASPSAGPPARPEDLLPSALPGRAAFCPSRQVLRAGGGDTPLALRATSCSRPTPPRSLVLSWLPCPPPLVGATIPPGATLLCVSPSRAEPPLLQGPSDSLLMFGVSGLGLLPPSHPKASPISHPIATMWYQGLNRFMISGSTQALAPSLLPHSLTCCSAHGRSPAPGDRGSTGSLPLTALRSFLVRSDPKSVSMVAPTPSLALPVPAPHPQPHWARSCPL